MKKKHTISETVKFKCYGCGKVCSVGYIENMIEPSLLHPMPPCKVFMIDQPAHEYLRKCREAS